MGGPKRFTLGVCQLHCSYWKAQGDSGWLQASDLVILKFPFLPLHFPSKIQIVPLLQSEVLVWIKLSWSGGFENMSA